MFENSTPFFVPRFSKIVNFLKHSPFTNLPERPNPEDIPDDVSLRGHMNPLFYKGLFPRDKYDYATILEKFKECQTFIALCSLTEVMLMLACLYIKRAMLEYSPTIRDQQYHQFGDKIHKIADRRKDLLEDHQFANDIPAVSSF
jgi:hypothetical protein